MRVTANQSSTLATCTRATCTTAVTLCLSLAVSSLTACKPSDDVSGDVARITATLKHRERIAALADKLSSKNLDLAKELAKLEPPTRDARNEGTLAPLVTGTPDDQHAGVSPELKAAWQAAVTLTQKDPPDIDAAITALRDVTAKKTDYATAWYSLGSILMKKGDRTVDGRAYEDALDALLHAAESGGEYTGVYNNLGASLRKLGRSDEAAPFLKHSVALSPHSTFAHNNLAEALIDLGRIDEARALLTQSKRLHPTDQRTNKNLRKLESGGGY